MNLPILGGLGGGRERLGLGVAVMLGQRVDQVGVGDHGMTDLGPSLVETHIHYKPTPVLKSLLLGPGITLSGWDQKQDLCK